MSQMLPHQDEPSSLKKAVDWAMFSLGALTLTIAVTATVANSLEDDRSASVAPIEVSVLPEML